MRRTVLLASGVCLLLTLVAFGRTLTQDFAPLDDDLLITHNLAVRGMTPENMKTIFTTYDPELYIPLTFVSYQINYMLAGFTPWTYHLTNILLHTGNAMLVMWVVLLLLKRVRAIHESPLHNNIIAIFAGLLFAVHPLNTEAVAWLAGRKDLLSALFFLAAWGTYICYRMGETRQRRVSTYWIGTFLFLCALLSKVMAMTLPAALILTDLWIEKRKWEWKMIVDKIPYAILSGIFLIVGTAGKERILSQHSILETALMAAKSTVFYLEKFLLPIRLGVFYPYRGEISILQPGFFIPIAVMTMIVGGILWALHAAPLRSDIKRWALFGTLFFLVTLAPTFINFHKGGEMYFASDRYPYVPMIGFIFIITNVFAMVAHRDAPAARLYMRWQWIVPGIIIITLTGLSYRQTKIWDSARTLFGNTLTLYPQSVAARSALATMDKNEGRYESAIKLLRDGLGYGDDARLRMGLGTVYAKMGRVENAADQFNQAFALEPDNPEPLVGLGVLDEYNKKIPEAMEKYRQAVAMDSSYVSARNKLGSLLFEQGKMEEAEEQFRAALVCNARADGVLFNLSLILDMQGKADEALDTLQKAHELNPDSPEIASALSEHLGK